MESLYRVEDAVKLVKGAGDLEEAFYPLADAAELVMGVERSGEAFYHVLADRRWSKEMQELFQFLGTQEAVHHAAFAGLVKGSSPAALNGEGDAREAGLRATFHRAVYGWPDETAGGLLKALSGALFRGRAFGWPGNILEGAKKVRNEEQAVHLAIGFEKDTLLLLYNLSDMITDSDQELLGRVIADEKTHVRLLNERL